MRICPKVIADFDLRRHGFEVLPATDMFGPLPGGDHGVFMAAMCIDGFSTGFAGTALVAYMSSLTSIGYTATQYALLSSFYALLGKVLKGLSGVAVEQLQALHGEIGGYALFFLGTAVTGVPALLLCLLLARRIRAPTDAPLAGRGPPG